MSTYERPLKVMTQIVWGIWDEDGKLVGERHQEHVEPVFYPFGLNLENRILALEKQAQARGKEG